MRRRAFCFAFIFLLLLGLCAWRWLSPERHANYVFLHVVESNSQAISYLPPGEHPLIAAFNPDNQALWVRTTPPPRTPVVVFFEMDTLGLCLYAQLWGLEPGDGLPLSQPLSFPAHPQGHSVIDNEQRQLRQDLVLVELAADGTVVLAWQGEHITLGPGEGWSVGQLGGEKPLPALPGGEWEVQLRAAWEAGVAASRLTVFNYGWWPRRQITVEEGI